jgi:hypothetical protein
MQRETTTSKDAYLAGFAVRSRPRSGGARDALGFRDDAPGQPRARRKIRNGPGATGSRPGPVWEAPSRLRFHRPGGATPGSFSRRDVEEHRAPLSPGGCRHWRSSTHSSAVFERFPIDRAFDGKLGSERTLYARMTSEPEEQYLCIVSTASSGHPGQPRERAHGSPDRTPCTSTTARQSLTTAKQSLTTAKQ